MPFVLSSSSPRTRARNAAVSLCAIFLRWSAPLSASSLRSEYRRPIPCSPRSRPDGISPAVSSARFMICLGSCPKAILICAGCRCTNFGRPAIIRLGKTSLCVKTFPTMANPIHSVAWKVKGSPKSLLAPSMRESSSPAIFASVSKAKQSLTWSRACISSTKASRSFLNQRRSGKLSNSPSEFPATRACRTRWLFARRSKH